MLTPPGASEHEEVPTRRALPSTREPAEQRLDFARCTFVVTQIRSPLLAKSLSQANAELMLIASLVSTSSHEAS